MMKLWVLTAVDTSDTADGRARTLGVYSRKDDAEAALKEDMDGFAKDMELDEREYVRNQMSIWCGDDYGCHWNIEEVESKIPTPDIEKAKEVLTDNGIDCDEADVVLQAVGYALLGVELYPED